MEIRVGQEIFKTKKELLAKVKGMLHVAELGVELDEPVHGFLLEFVKGHPEYRKKVGPGIRAFRVTTSEYGNRCFEVIRVDGTEEDFSYMKCVVEPSPKKEMLEALRRAVERQIWEAKEKVFLWDETIQCPITGEMITRDQAMVEYVGGDSFEWLAEEFFVKEGIEKDKLPIGPAANGRGKVLTDPALEARWQEFHERRAVFRVRNKNLSKEKQESESSDLF